jgi:integrase
MRWDELKKEHNTTVWHCPPYRINQRGDRVRATKNGKLHIVHLSKAALALIEEMRALQHKDGIKSDFIFVHGKPLDEYRSERRRRLGEGPKRLPTPAGRNRQITGSVVGDTGVIHYLQYTLGRKDLTVHGFRTTFRSWAKDEWAEWKSWSKEDCEEASGRTVEGDSEAIYTRDARRHKQRLKLMEEWADHCSRTQPPVGAVGAVVPFPASKVG